MGFLSTHSNKGSVTPVGNSNSKTKTTKIVGPPSSASKKSGSTDEKGGSRTSTSVWNVFLGQSGDNSKESSNAKTTKKDSPKSVIKAELNRVESKTLRRGSSSSLNVKGNTIEGNGNGGGNVVLLSKEALRELELQEGALPDRWLDFFCIVGLDSEVVLSNEVSPEGGSSIHKPVLLDRYPKENRPDMEFPEHLPTFCFPSGGCAPLRYKMRRHELEESDPKKSKKKSKTKAIKYHHNVPDPSLCSMVLTSVSGHRLYCTALTVYEMRVDKTPPKVEKEPRIEEDDTKESEEEGEEPTIVKEEEAKEPEPPPAPVYPEKWWEEPEKPNDVKTIPQKAESKTKPKKEIRRKENPSKVKPQKKEEERFYWMVPKCLVLMSHYPFFQAQSIALKELFYTVQSGSSPIPFERYIAHLLEDLPLPQSGVGRPQSGNKSGYTVVEWNSWIKPPGTARKKKRFSKQTMKIPPTIRLERPPPNQLPLLNVSMEPLFRTLSLSNILVLWATLLREGKVVLACSNPETTALLAPISEALLALLFPLEWQGIYVPVLPNHNSVLDVLEAPVPYLIGLVTKPSSSGAYNPHSHPSGVLWCDLDNDALHLGFKGDKLFYNNTNNQNEEEIPLLPALPSEASMTLKTDLEEIADPLYLPTVEGIKGRITVGDRTIELDNTLRQPYAQRTKLFDTPMATPRKYILTQSSKIPPRGKSLSYQDFAIVPSGKNMEIQTGASVGTKNTDEDDVEFCGLTLEDIQIPCGEDMTCVEVIPVGREEGKEKENDVVSKPETKASKEESSDSEDDTKPEKPERQDSTFMTSLKRQGRSVQAHVDRAMAVLGQDYATPSQYAKRNSSQQFGEDILGRQDEIAAGFFSVHNKETSRVTDRARECFLRFFVVTLFKYKLFLDSDTNRLNENGFVSSLNLPHRQREYVKDMVTSQMFEIFLQDTRSIKQRKLFDEYIIKHKNGNFGLSNQKSSKKIKRSLGTPLLDSSQWQNPTVVVPEQPCRVGMKEGRIYCQNRRFPDNLDPEECITNQSVSFWKRFWDGAFCSVFSSCM